MAGYTTIQDLFRVIWNDQGTQDHPRAVVNTGCEGTCGNITRSTTPICRSQRVFEPGMPFFYTPVQYDAEPEIPDYMRVSEGL